MFYNITPVAVVHNQIINKNVFIYMITNFQMACASIRNNLTSKVSVVRGKIIIVYKRSINVRRETKPIITAGNYFIVYNLLFSFIVAGSRYYTKPV